MKRPNGNHADLGTKLEDYSLNPLHRRGPHKARVFESSLGVTLANKEILSRALLMMAASSDEFIALGDNDLGQT